MAHAARWSRRRRAPMPTRAPRAARRAVRRRCRARRACADDEGDLAARGRGSSARSAPPAPRLRLDLAERARIVPRDPRTRGLRDARDSREHDMATSAGAAPPAAGRAASRDEHRDRRDNATRRRETSRAAVPPPRLPRSSARSIWTGDRDVPSIRGRASTARGRLVDLLLRSRREGEGTGDTKRRPPAPAPRSQDTRDGVTAGLDGGRGPRLVQGPEDGAGRDRRTVPHGVYNVRLPAAGIMNDDRADGAAGVLPLGAGRPVLLRGRGPGPVGAAEVPVSVLTGQDQGWAEVGSPSRAWLVGAAWCRDRPSRPAVASTCSSRSSRPRLPPRSAGHDGERDDDRCRPLRAATPSSRPGRAWAVDGISRRGARIRLLHRHHGHLLLERHRRDAACRAARVGCGLTERDPAGSA